MDYTVSVYPFAVASIGTLFACLVADKLFTESHVKFSELNDTEIDKKFNDKNTHDAPH